MSLSRGPALQLALLVLATTCGYLHVQGAPANKQGILTWTPDPRSREAMLSLLHLLHDLNDEASAYEEQQQPTGQFTADDFGDMSLGSAMEKKSYSQWRKGGKKRSDPDLELEVPSDNNDWASTNMKADMEEVKRGYKDWRKGKRVSLPYTDRGLDDLLLVRRGGSGFKQWRKMGRRR